MALYIVGTQRNKLNEQSIVRFTIWNSISNEFSVLSYTDLKNGILNNEIEVGNAEANFKSVSGKYYDLKALSYEANDKVVILDHYTILEKFADDSYLLMKYNLDSIDSLICNKFELLIMEKQGQVWNTENGMYKESTVSSDSVSNNISRSANKIGINTDKIQVESDRLTEEAFNPDIVWNMDKFKTFMKLNRWEYTVIPQDNGQYKITSVDPGCTILHLPEEVTIVDDLFEQRPVGEPIIIFGPLVRYIGALFKINCVLNTHGNNKVARVQLKYDMCNVNLDSEEIDRIRKTHVENIEIKSIYFQHASESQLDSLGNSDLDFGGLSFLNISDIADTPIGKKVERLYNFCKIQNIETINGNRLSYCFGRTEICQNSVGYNVELSYNCMRESKIIGDNSTVEVLDKVKKLDSSFIELDVQNINIGKATSLSHIESSFKSVDGLRDADLSQLQNFSTLRYSFQYCKNLSNFKLPPSVYDIGRECLKGSPNIKEVVIPDKFSYITGKPFIGCRVIYPKNVETICGRSHRFYQNAAEYEPVYTCTITKIVDRLSSADGELKDLKLPTTIESIPANCFESSRLTSYDSRLLPNVSVIPYEAFSSSYIITAIFGNNIRKIGKGIFDKCSNLKTVIFGDNIEEMETGLFSKCETESSIKVYVTRKSLANKKIRKSNKVIVISVDSVEEAIEMEYNNNTSENKQYKFDMLLAGTKFECLLHKKYRDYVGYLYALFKSIQNDEPYLSNEELILDRSKFGDISIDRIPKLREIVENAIKREEVDTQVLENRREFISLSNLITTVSKNYMYMLTDEIIDKINNKVHVQSMGCYIEVCKDAQILMVRLVDKDNVDIVATTIMIIYKDRLVYLTPFYNSDYIKNEMGNIRSALIYSTARKRHSNVGLGTALVPGDILTYVYGGDTTINNKPIPYELLSVMQENLDSTLRIIGIKDFNKKSKQKNREQIIYDALMIEVQNGKLIELSCKLSFDDNSTRLRNLSEEQVKRVYDIQDIGSIDEGFTCDLIKGFNNPKINSMLTHILMSDSTKDDIRANVDNYETTGDKNLIYLGELIYQNNIKSIDDVVKNRQLLKRILDSHLYENANISMNYIKKHELNYKRESIKPLGVKNEILLEFKAIANDGMQLHIAGVADGETTMNSKKFLMGSLQSVDNNIKLLYTIGLSRSNGAIRNNPGIDNSKINIDEYYVINSIGLKNFYHRGMKLLLAMDKFNADTYVLAEVWDTDFYKLFRTKTLANGVMLMRYLTTVTSKGISVQDKVIDLIDYLNNTSSSVRVEDNFLILLREEIMQGLPNNYPYSGMSPTDLVDILAKQPKYN